MEKVFILTETYEGNDVIREFNTLGVYEDITDAQTEMKELIKKDSYGFIKANGIFVDKINYFETNFSDGFLAYSIDKEEIICKTKRRNYNE